MSKKTLSFRQVQLGSMEVLKKLGLNVTCEPKYQIKEIFIG